MLNTLLLLLLLALGSSAQSNQPPAKALARWCMQNADVLATSELTQAKRVCLGSQTEDAQLCRRCQCRLAGALLPAAALYQQQQRAGPGGKSQAPSPAAISRAVNTTAQMMSSCLDVIVDLWGLLPSPGSQDALFQVAQCTWDPAVQPGLCSTAAGQAMIATNTPDDGSSTDASPEVAQLASLSRNKTSEWLQGGTLEATATWRTACDCDETPVTTPTLCDLATLQPYESACHAKCRGVPATATLQPCVGLFNTTRGPQPNFNTSAGAPGNPGATRNNTNPAATATTATPGGPDPSPGPTGTGDDDSDAYMSYYDYDGLPSTFSATVSQAVQAALQVPPLPPPASPKRDPTATAATRSSARNRRQQDGPVQVPCPWTAEQLYLAIGGDVLPGYLQDCSSALCLLTRVTTLDTHPAALPPPTSLTPTVNGVRSGLLPTQTSGNTSLALQMLPRTPAATTHADQPPDVLLACMPQLAGAVFLASGSSGRTWLQDLQACPPSPTASSSRNCKAVLARVTSKAPKAASYPPRLAGQTAAGWLPGALRAVRNVSSGGGQGPGYSTPGLADLVQKLMVLRDPGNTTTTSGTTSATSGKGLQNRSSTSASTTPQPAASTSQPRLTTVQGNNSSNSSTRPEPQEGSSSSSTSTTVLPDSPVWAFRGPTLQTSRFNASASTPAAPGDPLAQLQSGGGLEADDPEGGSGGQADVRWPGLCVCDTKVYEPVCRAWDLKWFPSACYAKCQGADESELGPCRSSQDAPASSADDYYGSYYYY